MTTTFYQLSAFDIHVKQKFNLSNRELEVWKLIANGYQQNQITRKLFLSLSTIKTHRRLLYRKLDIKQENNCKKKIIAAEILSEERNKFHLKDKQIYFPISTH